MCSMKINVRGITQNASEGKNIPGCSILTSCYCHFLKSKHLLAQFYTATSFCYSKKTTRKSILILLSTAIAVVHGALCLACLSISHPPWRERLKSISWARYPLYLTGKVKRIMFHQYPLIAIDLIKSETDVKSSGSEYSARIS